MQDQHSPQPEPNDSHIDPSIWRGMTQRRMSRRQMLRAAGTGAGALGVSAFLAACGVKGATVAGGSSPKPGGVGSPSWWAKQKLNHTVNFGNWPLYIDVLKGKRPTLEHFAQLTGIKVNYTEPISDNLPFYAKIRPSLQAQQYTGYDIIVMTNNSPPLGYLINYGWLTPLDQSAMVNFHKYASPLVSNPSWDRGNKYTMAWQSGWTAIGYNSSIIKTQPTSVDILFDPKYSGKVGMMADPQELGSVGLLKIGVEPATSTESDWARAAKVLQQQKSDGIVRAYYDQSYITALKNGDTVVSQAWSGDIFQADVGSYKNLRLVIPDEGGMFWTDNMCIPMYAQNPKDAMAVMDYYYNPEVQAVVEYYVNYVCPVPHAQQVLLNPTGWAAQTLEAMKPSIGLPFSKVANAPTVFPNGPAIKASRPYYQYKSQEELTAWNNLFLPITQGS
jgi:spermidine/putrescine transport system substrate-binding protein